MAAVVTTPHDEIDHWAPVARDALPNALVVAIEQRDWPLARRPSSGTPWTGSPPTARTPALEVLGAVGTIEPTSCWLGSRAAVTTSETALA